MDFARTDHPPSTHVDLLDRYIGAMEAPGVVPDGDLYRPTLWHPDLHGGNIITDSDPCTPISIRGIIDWQHSCIRPAALCPPIPPVIKYDGDLITILPGLQRPKLPEAFNLLSKEDQRTARWEHKLATWEKIYSIVALRHPLRRQIDDIQCREILNVLYEAASRSWDEHFLMFRYALAALQEQWPGLTDCPIGFSPEEVLEALEDHDCQGRYIEACEAVYRELGCDDEGVVSPTDFDVAISR